MMSQWPDTAVDRMVSTARLERYARGTLVLSQDRQRREVLLVVSGGLEISGTSVDGTKFVLSVCGHGEVVALARLLDRSPWHFDFHAHEDLVLVHLPCDPFLAMLDEHPILWKDIALMALARQLDSIVSLQHRALLQLHQSLAETLVTLADQYGEPAAGGVGVRLRVSQSDLASMLSVTRQTINKELRRLSGQGLVVTKYGYVTVLNLMALQRIAGVRP